MERSGNIKVTIYTQTYNAKAFLGQCLDSVMAQTYPNFEYILVDNGCTDGSSEMIERYASQDRRIKRIRFPENRREIITDILKRYTHGDYYTILDSDDWWEPNYLERLTELAAREGADIVCTGTIMHMEGVSQTFKRCLDRRLVIDQREYAEAFPIYHVHFRANWAKLIRTELFFNSDFTSIDQLEFPYGKDTLRCFNMLKKANRICLDDSALHHYRIHKKSSSYRYDPKRFVSDTCLYHDAIGFLSAYGPISPQNRDFIQRVYANAVTDTVNVIRNCDLPVPDKLREYRAIVSHPLTLATYRECVRDDAVRSRKNLLLSVLQAGGDLEGESDEDLRAALQALSPRCGQAVSGTGLPLFLSEPSLLQALLQDDPEAASQILLRRMETGQGAKRFAIPEMLQALAAENPLLCQITDAAFLRKYARLYRMVWRGETLPALEEMTGLLLDGRVNGGGRETFLRLYISLAAMENQAPAFVFGKLQLAKLYLGQGRREECRAAVEELAEMGADGEELAGLRRGLEGDG